MEGLYCFQASNEYEGKYKTKQGVVTMQQGNHPPQTQDATQRNRRTQRYEQHEQPQLPVPKNYQPLINNQLRKIPVRLCSPGFKILRESSAQYIGHSPLRHLILSNITPLTVRKQRELPNDMLHWSLSS
jgi:hypothetical protein